MSAETPEQWADRGLLQLYGEMRLDLAKEVPLRLIEVAASLRAAYALGYQAALAQNPPLDLQDAMARAETLRLRVPVS
jgi:hypothetical protein